GLRLTYQFEPGADADGVTVHIPVQVLNQVLTQHSEDRHLHEVYMDLLDSEGSEIYLKPAAAAANVPWGTGGGPQP
ncbi:DUF3418 domain-containing protein, partial [Actinomadura rugatobispora]